LISSKLAVFFYFSIIRIFPAKAKISPTKPVNQTVFLNNPMSLLSGAVV